MKSGRNMMNKMAVTQVYKKGGHAMMKKSNGGTIYEREMEGEKPHTNFNHFNYEGQMRGEHPTQRAQYAAGGVAKMRHCEADSMGKPMKTKNSKTKVY